MSGEPIKGPTRPKSGRRGSKKRRIPARTDMTAMVDIVMLLLIFYMVTTVFMMPQAMEINMPENTRERIPVKWSKVLTFRIDGNNHFMWNVGDPAEKLPQMIPSIPDKNQSDKFLVDSDSLRAILWNLNHQIDSLNTVIKISPDARYTAMVDLLDEIDYLEWRWNMQAAVMLGKAPEELTRDERFSYRYAIDVWEDTDDRIADAVLSAAGEGGEYRD
ncbi:MAG: biopolymer transporter ExbD [Candidatus Zixiibacteriota bacterium]